MHVDSKGSRVINGWWYRLDGKRGQVFWNWNLKTYEFVMIFTRPDGTNRIVKIPLKFTPLEDAPRVKQCKALERMKRSDE